MKKTPKFNPEAEWLLPFFKKVRHLLPKTAHLTTVSLEKPRGRPIKLSFHAQLAFDPWNKTFTMIIRSHGTKVLRRKPLKVGYCTFSVIDTLEAFAHELAHVKDMTHSPEHKLLECRIKAVFMRKLLRDGYINDETYAPSYEFY